MPQEWIEQLGRRTRSSKTRRLYQDGEPTRKYSWDGVVGTSLHYPDVEGAWQDVDVNAEEPDTDGFALKFTELPYFARIAEDGRRRIYLDRNDLSYWIEFGKPFPSMGVPSRFERWFHWDFPHARIGVRFDPDSIKFGFRLKNDHAPTSITIPFETQGITRVGRLLYHDGEVVGALRRPIATGSNLDEFGMPVQKDCEIAFAPGEVTISLDPTGLEYPIDIDPTVDKQVAASGDDGGVKGPPAPLFYGDGNYIKYGYDTVTYHGFYRWIGVSIEGTIETSYAEIYNIEQGNPDVDIHGVKEDNPPAPTTYTEFTADPLTDSYANWTTTYGSYDWHQTPSLNGLFQELVDTYTISDDAVMIQIKDSYEGEESCYYNAYSYDFNSFFAAKLHIEYTVGGAPITLTPTPGTFAIIAVNPAIALGTLTMTPTAASLPIVAADPVMQLTYTVVPTVVASPVIAPAPSLALSLAISPSAAVIPIIAADPLIAIDQFFTPTPATMPLAIPNPAISLTLALLPTPAGSPIVAADPMLTLTLPMAPTAATIPIATPAPTIALGTLSLTPTAATIPMAIANPIVALTLALDPTPAIIPLVVAVPTMGLTFELSPVVIPLVVANPALSLSLSLATSPAILPLVVADPGLVLTLVLVSTPATVPLVATAPVLIIGGLPQTLLALPAALTLIAPGIIIARPQGFTVGALPAAYRLDELMPSYVLEALPADYRIEELRW